MKKIIGMIFAVILGLILSGCAAQDALRADQAQLVQDKVDEANAKAEAAKQEKLKKIRGEARPSAPAMINAPVNSLGVPAVPSLPSLYRKNGRPVTAPAPAAGTSPVQASKVVKSAEAAKTLKTTKTTKTTKNIKLIKPAKPAKPANSTQSAVDNAAASGDTVEKADIAKPGD